MKTLSIVLLSLLLAASARAQTFTIIPDGPPIEHAWQVPGPRPSRGTIVRLDPAALAAHLALAPTHSLNAPLADYALPIALPDPTGKLVDCLIAQSPVMEPALQDKFPQIRTYIVQTADRSAAGRLELSPRGLTAMLRTTDGGAWMIDPWRTGDPAHAVSYLLRDLPGGGDFACHTVDAPEPPAHAPAPIEDRVPAAAPRGGSHILRTIRFAMACTGEYGLHQCTVQGNPPNAADPLAAIVTVVARTNVVYEADLAVHFNLVASNDQIVFFEPATDPYPDTCDGVGGSDCSGVYLSANVNALDNILGNSAFDLGHLLTRVYGGVANLSCVCNSNKARGISGIPRGGDIDPLTALVVIHEIGHQLGARHTFSGTRGRCAGNVTLSTAWEAGSGSSPMAYPGGCPVGDAAPSDNIVIFADPFFHHGSIREMSNILNDRDCPVETASGNTAPAIISISADQAIPPGTPFELSCEATDADDDELTYSWEQYDSGAARPLSGEDAVDNGEGALFRIFPPVLASARSFPQLADVLSAVPTPGEMLPTFPGVNRRFRVIVRDNNPGAGGTAISSFVDLTIGGGSPFAFTAPAEAAQLHAGPTNITWTVGQTSSAPISCSSITIHLSLDDGATFSELLGTFPNTGAATITLPAIEPPSAPARLRIQGEGRVFYNISRPFTLRAICAADFDANHTLDVEDIFTFLTAWFASDPAAYNFGGTPGVPAIFAFLTSWFAGCP